MDRITTNLMAALRAVLRSDGHDRDCPKVRRSRDRACSSRCSQARAALADAQAQLLLRTRTTCTWCGGSMPSDADTVWYAGSDRDRTEPCCSENCALENEATLGNARGEI